MEHLRDHEAERMVIALVLEQPDRAEETGLSASDFDDPRNAAVWGGILSLVSRHAPVSDATLAQALRDHGAFGRAGGAEYLNSLLTAAVGLPLLQEQVGRVRDRAIRRRAMAALQETSAAIRDTGSPATEITAAGAERLAKLASDGADEPRHVGVVADGVVRDMHAARRGEASTVIPTGIGIFDRTLGGLQCGNIGFQGAQPRIGKSAVLLTMALEIARGSREGSEVHRPPVGTLFFSQEDPAEWIPRRALALYTRTSIKQIRSGELNDHQLERVEETAKKFHGIPLWIYDSEGLTAKRAVTIARRMIRRHNIRVILVDHLLELVPDNDSSRLARDERIGEAVAALRDLAKNTRTPGGLPIAVEVAVHLKRPDRSDDDPMYVEPNLSSFAGSAFIERRARRALGYYRPRPPPPPEDAAPEEMKRHEALVEEAKRTICCKVLKQTEGQDGCDFAMMLYAPAGAVDPRLGYPLTNTRGFTPSYEEEKE